MALIGRILLLSCLFASRLATAAALGSSFSYQGSLDVSGLPANGSYDLQVALYDVSSGGAAIATSAHADVMIADGVFTLALDYTSVPFESATQYYLELQVREGASTGAYTALAPRQPLQATPYALHAASVDTRGLTLPKPLRVTREFNLAASPFGVAGESSVTVGVDGLPIVSVYEASDGDLQVIHCEDLACSQATVTEIDSAGIVGRGNSIAIGANGLPVISYIDVTNGDLKLAACADLRCSSATLRVVDANVGASNRTSVMQTNGTGYLADIVYYDALQGDLESAHCPTSGSCTLTTLDSANSVGAVFDVVHLGTRYYVAYSDATFAQLKLKTCSYVISNCGAATALTVDADVPMDLAMTVGADQLPLMLYVRNTDQVYAANCTTSVCTAFSTPHLTAYGVQVAAALSADHLPIMATVNSARTSLSLYKCADPLCTGTALSATGIGSASADARPAVTLGAHGFPVVAYRLNDRLDLLVCDTPECGNVRQR